MRTAEERIRELAKNQAIDDADAKALLGAVGASPALQGLSLWKNPSRASAAKPSRWSVWPSRCSASW